MITKQSGKKIKTLTRTPKQKQTSERLLKNPQKLFQKKLKQAKILIDVGVVNVNRDNEH